jgi:hypothetical protein
MADAQLKLSRRSLLAAACASPLAATRPVRSERSRGPAPSAAEALLPAWTRALTDYRRAEATVAALEGTSDDDAFNAAADTHDRALERLLLAPAPDLPAFAAKLRLARGHQAWELAQGDALMQAVEQDALRLAGDRG